MTSAKTINIHPIGIIRRKGSDIRLEIDEPYRPALKQLGEFSHVLILWWGNRADNEEHRAMLQTRPPYAESVMTGVFATRAEYRPNPIEVTVSQILDVDEKGGIIRLANIDAFDGSPILDLKAYFPVCDRVREARIPSWLEGWPEWVPDEGIGLWEGEPERGPD